MERDGLITRTRAQEDQRRLLVSLTPQSRKLVTEIGPRIDEQYRQLESRFVGTASKTSTARSTGSSRTGGNT